VLVCDSGLPDDTFNIVAAARFATAPDERIARSPGGFGPSSTPADLSDRLVTLGLPVGEREAAMWSPTSRRPVSRDAHVATTRVVAANDDKTPVAAAELF